MDIFGVDNFLLMFRYFFLIGGISPCIFNQNLFFQFKNILEISLTKLINQEFDTYFLNPKSSHKILLIMEFLDKGHYFVQQIFAIDLCWLVS